MKDCSEIVITLNYNASSYIPQLYFYLLYTLQTKDTVSENKGYTTYGTHLYKHTQGFGDAKQIDDSTNYISITTQRCDKWRKAPMKALPWE